MNQGIWLGMGFCQILTITILERIQPTNKDMSWLEMVFFYVNFHELIQPNKLCIIYGEENLSHPYLSEL